MNSVTTAGAWVAPTNKTYVRIAAYWFCLSIVVCATESRFRFLTWATLIFFLLATPGAIIVLSKLSAALRRYVSMRTLHKTPELEFSPTGLMTFRLLRLLLVVVDIGVALATAKLLALLLF